MAAKGVETIVFIIKALGLRGAMEKCSKSFNRMALMIFVERREGKLEDVKSFIGHAKKGCKLSKGHANVKATYTGRKSVIFNNEISKENAHEIWIRNLFN